MCLSSWDLARQPGLEVAHDQPYRTGYLHLLQAHVGRLGQLFSESFAALWSVWEAVPSEAAREAHRRRARRPGQRRRPMGLMDQADRLRMRVVLVERLGDVQDHEPCEWAP